MWMIPLRRCDSRLPIWRFMHNVTRAGQEITQDAAQVFLVLDDENALAGHGRTPRSGARIGSRSWNVAPRPDVDSTQICPPCISTICLAMARPRPVPPFALVLELSTW